jgi:hypothetical protein
MYSLIFPNPQQYLFVSEASYLDIEHMKPALSTQSKGKGKARAQAHRQIHAAVGGVADPLGRRRQFIGPVLPAFKKKRPGRGPNSPEKKATLTVVNLLASFLLAVRR